MRLGWVGLLNLGSDCLSVCGFLHSTCGCFLRALLELPLVCEALPGPWASLQDGVKAGTVIGDATAGADSRSGEGDKVPRSQYHLSKHLYLLI